MDDRRIPSNEDVIREVNRYTESLMVTHEERLHVVQYDPETVERMVEEHNALVRMGPAVAMITDDLYGPLEPDVDGNLHRKGGLMDEMKNSGIRIKFSKGAWAAIVALIGTTGTMAVALIQNL